MRLYSNTGTPAARTASDDRVLFWSGEVAPLSPALLWHGFGRTLREPGEGSRARISPRDASRGPGPVKVTAQGQGEAARTAKLGYVTLSEPRMNPKVAIELASQGAAQCHV